MPNNVSVTLSKPSNLVIDIKPSNNSIKDQTQIYTEIRSIYKGNPIGLLLTLTYPEDIINFTAIRS
jgi:hypothetical protein